MNTTPLPIQLFVYGTLKRGFRNHARFCRQAVNIQPATVWGRLYHLPAGYPALEVPESSILAYGTGDSIADAGTQHALHVPEFVYNRPEGDWDLVHGELITFGNPNQDLPPIDRLEDFNPSGRSLYQRVLVTVVLSGAFQNAWLYHYKKCKDAMRIGTEFPDIYGV